MNFSPGTFQGLHGDEIKLMSEIIAAVEGQGVEIGCCDGFSTGIILSATKPTFRLTSIDPLIPDSMEASLVGNRDRLMENTKEFGDRWTFVFGYSEHVLPTWGTADPRVGKIDFLFIDGDHRYEPCKRDILGWTPLLKQGAILAIHDSRMGRPGSPKFHEGPSQAAAELIYGQPDQWEIVGEAFTLTVAKKK